MKTFEDLRFDEHPSIVGWKRAVYYYPNHYGVSVVAVKGDVLYEVAVMDKHGVCYSTHLTDDVIKDLNEEQVSHIMLEVEKLK